MLIVISPSKTLDYDSPLQTKAYSEPTLLNYSEKLIKYCQALTEQDIANLMNISPKLASLNYQRFQTWQSHSTPDNTRQAILAFKGDVYEGLAVDDFTQQDFQFAQQHMRILSGLYGILKPLDLIQAYRLEMGISLKNGDNNNLYQFWGSIITEQLNQILSKDTPLINLASNEYIKAIKVKQLKSNIIQPIFLDESNNQYKVISFYAKKARGLMSRYIIKNQLQQARDLCSFNLGGYQFDSHLSDENKWLFKRSNKQAEQYKHHQNH